MSARIVTLTEAELGALVGSTATTKGYPFAVAVALNALGAAADDIEALSRSLAASCDPRLCASLAAVGLRLDAVQVVVERLARAEMRRHARRRRARRQQAAGPGGAP